MSDLKTQLEKDLATISWQEILPHAKRDAVVVIDQDLDILDVAEAIALDNSSQINDWILHQLIAKPSAQQLTKWNSEPKLAFTAAIVQPFVIIKPNH